jgi:hypothetical protein
MQAVSGPQLWLLLLGLAIVVDGLLAGASLDQSIKQLPARHRIGMRAFSTYSRASDLASGVFWYAGLGIAGAVLTLATAAWGLTLELSPGQRLPLLLAAALAIAHSLTTARAAPINWSQRAVAEDESALARVFQRFEHWQTARAVLQLATFLALVDALLRQSVALR